MDIDLLGNIDILEFLKLRAETDGINPVQAACKQFLKGGKQVLAEAAEKRKPVPRKWTEAAAKRQGMLCADCGRELQLYFQDREDYATWDHIVPVNGGGEHSRRNGRAICQRCNSIKSDKDPVDYSKRTGNLMTQLNSTED